MNQQQNQSKVSSKVSDKNLTSYFPVLISIVIGFLALYLTIFSHSTSTITSTTPMSTVTSAAASAAVKGFVPRAIIKKFLAIEQAEGVGARVRRSIGSMSVRNFTPFLMLDHFTAGPGAGFPDHPHRGQETITYMIKGYVDHEDFTGNGGTIGPGDLQFMTAGRGIVHAEMPRIGDDGIYPEAMQLWVDLPKELKECEPRYRDLMAAEIPIAKPNDKVEVKVISGVSYGIESVKDLAYTPVWFLDVKLQPGGNIEQELPKDFNGFIYLLSGNIKVNRTTKVPQYHAVIFDREGDGIQVEVEENATEEARFVLIAGKVLEQPIVQHGPFVETSREKIMKAFIDYQTGSNGFERAHNWESKIGHRNDY